MSEPQDGVAQKEIDVTSYKFLMSRNDEAQFVILYKDDASRDIFWVVLSLNFYNVILQFPENVIQFQFFPHWAFLFCFFLRVQEGDVKGCVGDKAFYW